MELYHGDCLEILPGITQTVDLVVVDLPYGEMGNLKWDIQIPLEKVWENLNRVCKEDCVYLFFGSMKFGMTLIDSNRKNFRYEIIWNKLKGSNFMMANKMPLKCHEFVFVFYKKTGTYNPQKTVGTPYTQKAIVRTGGCYQSSYANYNTVVNTGDRFPVSILECRKSSKNHPTEKPINLLENLIKQYSNENDTVLDFTMGSGSTGVACKNTNRKFIGIEKDPKYFKIAQDRCL